MQSAGLMMVHGFPKKDQGEHIKHPQDLNVLISTTNIDDATRKIIQSCSIVSATPSTAMRLDHLMTGEKYSDKKLSTSLSKLKVQSMVKIPST
jgi:hypothetical protein